MSTGTGKSHADMHLHAAPRRAPPSCYNARGLGVEMPFRRRPRTWASCSLALSLIRGVFGPNPARKTKATAWKSSRSDLAPRHGALPLACGAAWGLHQPRIRKVVRGSLTVWWVSTPVSTSAPTQRKPLHFPLLVSPIWRRQAVGGLSRFSATRGQGGAVATAVWLPATASASR